MGAADHGSHGVVGTIGGKGMRLETASGLFIGYGEGILLE